MDDNYRYSDVTQKIIRAFFNVYNKLGFGFLEKVYERALIIEFDKLFLCWEQQKRLKVYYDDNIVGEFYADLVVEGCVIIEIKAVESIRSEHEVQLVNYLRSTPVEVGLLLNFGPRPQYKRRVFANSRKKSRIQ